MVESALRDIIGWASMIYFESAYICRFSSSVCANQPRDLKNESAHIVFFCFDKQILVLGIQPACDEGRKVANKDLKSGNVKKMRRSKDSRFVGNLLALYSIFSRKGKEQSYRDGTPKC